MKLILYIISLQVCVKNPNGIFLKKLEAWVSGCSKGLSILD